jgi:hypothetical protein
MSTPTVEKLVRARTLAPRQYQPNGEPIIKAPRPFAVRAWIVTDAGDDLEVEGLADAWTRRAVHVRYPTERPTGDAWVWTGSVTRL